MKKENENAALFAYDQPRTVQYSTALRTIPRDKKISVRGRPRSHSATSGALSQHTMHDEDYSSTMTTKLVALTVNIEGDSPIIAIKNRQLRADTSTFCSSMSSENLEDSKPAAVNRAAPNANDDDDDDDSDVVLTGMDMDGADDDEAMPTAEDEDVDMTIAADEAEQGFIDSVAAQAEEANEIKEARKERMELAAAVTKTKGMAATADPQQRLQYLLAQSEVFGHFLAGSVAAGAKKGKGRGKKGRLTEQEEDAQLLKTADSKRRVVRLDKQPSILAPHCKMHPYQCKLVGSSPSCEKNATRLTSTLLLVPLQWTA
jgi:hypothetical protein